MAIHLYINVCYLKCSFSPFIAFHRFLGYEWQKRLYVLQKTVLLLWKWKGKLVFSYINFCCFGGHFTRPCVEGLHNKIKPWFPPGFSRVWFPCLEQQCPLSSQMVPVYANVDTAAQATQGHFSLGNFCGQGSAPEVHGGWLPVVHSLSQVLPWRTDQGAGVEGPKNILYNS